MSQTLSGFYTEFASLPVDRSSEAVEILIFQLQNQPCLIVYIFNSQWLLYQTYIDA
jgi:hypothetical protein